MKSYYTVNVVNRDGIGNRTYIDDVVETHLFAETEKKKAIALWKKGAHNTITRTEVTYLDVPPYAEMKTEFGNMETEYDENYNSKKVLKFKKQDVVIEL